MPIIILNDMPALCVAIGSFQVKSPTTYLVLVLMIVLVTPEFEGER